MRKATLTSAEALTKAFGANPLLTPLPPFVDIDSMPEFLSSRPLDSIPWQRVPVAQRCDFLGLMRGHFVPTPEAIEIAFAMQQMIRTGYIERHPGLPCNLQQRIAISQIPDTDLRTAPWFPRSAVGMVISGITGLGKTFITSRVLDLIPRTYLHGRYERGGWSEQTQIVYIKVSMSADSSRLGFLDNILVTVDEAIASCGKPMESYYKMYGGKSARMSTEKLMVKIGKILSQFFCGLLIIEELQPRNFSGDQELVFLFILRLLNFGIPILLIGNPSAFDDLKIYAQDNRRIYKGKNFELWPAQHSNDGAWKMYVEGKMQCTLVPIAFDYDDDLFKKIFDSSGGIHDYFDTLWNIVQENALRKKKNAIVLDDIDVAYNSTRMKEYRPLITSLVERDVERLRSFADIPTDRFADLWRKLSNDDKDTRDSGTEADSSSPPTSSGKKRGTTTQHPQKSRVDRGKEANANFQARSNRATKAQQAAKEKVSPDAAAAARRSNAKTMLKQMEQLKATTSGH